MDESCQWPPVLMSCQNASADSGIVPPALNEQGFYDTMWGYLMTSLHVRLVVLHQIVC